MKAAVGVVGALLLLASCSDSQAARDMTARDFQREMADRQSGHYQMLPAPQGEGGVYVLDTHIGKVSHCYTKPLDFQTWCNEAADAANGLLVPPN